MKKVINAIKNSSNVIFVLSTSLLFGSCSSEQDYINNDSTPLVSVNANRIDIWHPIELTFTGPETTESTLVNPFTDYRIDAIFTSPSNKTYTVPGFYAADGNAANSHATSGNKWKIMFSPNEVGNWTYQASFVTGKMISATIFTTQNRHSEKSAGFFDGQKGNFTVIQSDVTNQELNQSKDFQNKGKLAYVQSPYLQFQGNKEFFLKGGANSPEVFLGYGEFDSTNSTRHYAEHIQDWKIGDPTWLPEDKTDASATLNGKGLIGLVNYLASLDINSFYFLTMNRDGDGKQVWPWTSETDIFRYDVSKLAQWDIVFKHMQEKGILTQFVLSETENESLFEWLEGKNTDDIATSRKIYYRELFARFGYHLATTWNIGEENGWDDPTGNDKQKRANTTEQRLAFADYFSSLTYYNEHIVIHNGPSEDYHIFNDENILVNTSITGPSLQGDLKSKKVYRDVLKYRQLTQSTTHPWVVSMDEPYTYSLEVDNDLWRIENVWATYMAGGAGIEFYLGGGGDLTIENLRPFNEYYKTIAVAKNFFKEHVPFSILKPEPTFVKNAWTLSQTGEFYLIYMKRYSVQSIDLPAGIYETQWFNPRLDVLHSEHVVKLEQADTLTIDTPPDSPKQDWVFMIKRKETL